MAHNHVAFDTDNRFSVNGETRDITLISSVMPVLVQYDHNSDFFCFEMPRYVNGHDMTLCSSIGIHFINVDSRNPAVTSKDVYYPDDITPTAGTPEKITFSWKISGNATRYAGTLNFLIRFICLTDDTLEYAWNTAIFKGIIVSDGMDNGEAVMEEYGDAFEAWKREMEESISDRIDEVAVGIASVEQTVTSLEELGQNVVTVTLTNGETYTFTVRNGLYGKPAYEYAQDGGYTGTEAQFNADLAAFGGLADWLASY